MPPTPLILTTYTEHNLQIKLTSNIQIAYTTMERQRTSSSSGSGYRPNKDELPDNVDLDSFINTGKVIGEGSVGKVYQMIYRGTGKRFAMKEIAKDRIEKHNLKEYLFDEVNDQISSKKKQIH